MDRPIHAALLQMIRHNRGDKKRIEHSLKVFAYAALLGKMEGLDPENQFILELTAILHDTGIRVSENKYGFSDGKKQETEGPPVARKMLEKLEVNPAVIERVCFIISKHHTFSAIDGMDFQLLVEADFLVNSVEEEVSPEGIRKFVELNFKTGSGRKLIAELFAWPLTNHE
jgi:uncharacterized protein